jgi:superfamily II DNA/RNA helicase
MTPTRELATQVREALRSFLGHHFAIKIALLIGGEPIGPQFHQLRARPRLVIGTPGRINDHLERKSLSLRQTQFLILDEVDRMLDMGFGIQLEKIEKHLPKKRQTLMFSATLPPNIVDLSQKYLINPIRVSVGNSHTPATNVKQDLLRVSEENKYDHLVQELDQRTGSIIVFVKTKYGAEKLTQKLKDDKHSVDTIHGDLRQNKRERVIHAFRNRKNRILVATDVAARGLDIPHIEHVINYDLPQCPEDYIHRIGRTARAGAEGAALNLVTRADERKWRSIERLLNPSLPKEKREFAPRPSSRPRPEFKNRSFSKGFPRKRNQQLSA